MARVSPPGGYDSWNVYIEEQADASPDQSREAIMFIPGKYRLFLLFTSDKILRFTC